MNDVQKFICCFCKEEFIGYGNNPFPANKKVGARCCDDCNNTIVVPARFKVMNGGKDECK